MRSQGDQFMPVVAPPRSNLTGVPLLDPDSPTIGAPSFRHDARPRMRSQGDRFMPVVAPPRSNLTGVPLLDPDSSRRLPDPTARVIRSSRRAMSHIMGHVRDAQYQGWIG